MHTLTHIYIYIYIYMTSYVCATVVDACISNPCQHNGRCAKTTDGFQCRCSGTYIGDTCSGRYCYSVIHRNSTSDTSFIKLNTYVYLMKSSLRNFVNIHFLF